VTEEERERESEKESERQGKYGGTRGAGRVVNGKTGGGGKRERETVCKREKRKGRRAREKDNTRERTGERQRV